MSSLPDDLRAIGSGGHSHINAICNAAADEIETKASSVAGLVEYAQSLERKIEDLERRNGRLSAEVLRLRGEFQ